MILEYIKRGNKKSFNIDKLKGSIAEKIIESILIEAGYEVYPFGYETFYRSLLDTLSKNIKDTEAQKLRSFPDLFVFDRKNNKSYILEVKFTNTTDEKEYWLQKHSFDKYVKFWSESILVVFSAKTKRVYCKRVNEIDIQNIPVKTSNRYGKNYSFDLTKDFHSISKYFLNIDEKKSNEYFKKIKEILRLFN